jgi:4-nitrophenyl phosphatase
VTVEWPGVRGLLIDLDGVVYTGNEPIAGGAAFLARSRARGVPFLLITNNSTTSAALVAERLGQMGIAVSASEILTSAQAAAGFVRVHGGGRVFVVGEDGLREAIVEEGLVVADDDSVAPDWVVAGLDRTFDYQKLTHATRAILAGARFLATNADALLPVEGGQVIPGAGSIVAALHTATGQAPIVVGKPEPGLFEHGLRRLGNLPPGAVVMIGDRLDTDVVGGRRAGLRTILALSGVTSAQQVTDSATSPDAIVPNLAAVGDVLGWT